MKKIRLLIIFVWQLQATAQIAADTIPAGWWRVPKTEGRITFYGYVKADMIHDFNPINGDLWFNVVQIPTDSAKGTNSQILANETRMMFDYITPAGNNIFRTYVEGDFYGSGGTIRLRHAFLEINRHWLAGQTWANFMDEDVIPQNLDVEKSQGFPFNRHGIIRYKTETSPHSYASFALEAPVLSTDNPSTPPGASEDFIPDLTGRYRYTNDWGYIQCTGMIGSVRFRPTTGPLQYAGLWGLGLSGRYNFFKQDFVLYQVSAGRGITRYYHAQLNAAPNSENQLQGIFASGYLLSITHFWTPKLTSLAMANYELNDNLAGQPGSDLKSTLYSAVDLIYHFHPSAFIGLEYLYGFRTDKDGAKGHDNRVQFSLRVDFNKQEDFNHREY